MLTVQQNHPGRMDDPAASFSSSGPAASSCDAAAPRSQIPELAVGISNKAQIGVEQDTEADESVPASPITVNTMQQLLKRPFADVLKEITTTMQLKSTAHVAAEQLRHLLHHDSSHHAEVVTSPVMGLLVSLVRESPGLPASGSAMAVLAMLALTPQGRETLRAEQATVASLKFLHIKGVLQKPNAEAALMLLQNASCDRLTRQALHKAEALPVLLELLVSNANLLKVQPRLSGPLAGFLSNMVVGDSDSNTAKQAFVRAGGIEAVCKVLSEWGRYDRAPATQRLQLLLSEVSSTPQYTMRVQELAGGNAMLAGGQPGSSRAAPTAPGSTSGAAALLGKGVPLGTPRMPASDRITSEVLKHTPSDDEPHIDY